jgi:hypothetical protein
MNKYLFFPFSDKSEYKANQYERVSFYSLKKRKSYLEPGEISCELFPVKVNAGKQKGSCFFHGQDLSDLKKRYRLRLVAGNGGCNRRRKRLLDRWWSLRVSRRF